MTMTPDRARSLLAEIQARLEAQAPAQEASAGGGDAVAHRLAVATEERRVFNLRRVRLALERLAAGEFGYCQSCGEDIAPERIEADPLAPTCGGCAAQRAL
ncbi:MAG: TraR/DksA family transcriptional regulator [Phenylobacterium sp.]|uniref:TraR/DksA family transcriptional regulator n=1 Tax=Phenylobacterium sp. TaxID=1871053 RepID=UPI00391D3947